jgi:dCMP deaminase
MTCSDNKFMDMAIIESKLSKGLSTKTGCVIVNTFGMFISKGRNELPNGVIDEDSRRQRPLKYLFTEHAERNAIYAAAKDGLSLDGSTAYVNWFPCVDCARAMIQSGISRLVCLEVNMDHSKYKEEFILAGDMLKEAGVHVEALA